MGLKDSIAGWFKIKDPVTMVKDLADGAADIVDRFITNPEEKQKALQQLREFKLAQMEVASKNKERALTDRQGARTMAPVHKWLQSVFAISFLIFFFVVLIGEFVFIGMLISWVVTGGAVIPPWLQALVANMLGVVLGYMSSMMKEIVGFLFGGSVGGDDLSQALTQQMRTVPVAPTPEDKAVDSTEETPVP